MFLGLGEMDITQFFENLSIVNGRAPLGDFGRILRLGSFGRVAKVSWLGIRLAA